MTTKITPKLSFNSKAQRFHASVTDKGKFISLGTFTELQDAVNAIDSYLTGENADDRTRTWWKQIKNPHENGKKLVGVKHPNTTKK